MIPKRYRGIWDIVIHFFLLKKQVNVLINESYDRFHFFFFQSICFCFCCNKSSDIRAARAVLWRTRYIRICSYIEEEVEKQDPKADSVTVPTLDNVNKMNWRWNVFEKTIWYQEDVYPVTKYAEVPTRPTQHIYQFSYYPYQICWSSNTPYSPHLPILIPSLPNLL